MQIDYPFHLDPRQRTATTDEDDHIRDLIEQVLFTAPGERVNRPDFGSGLHELIFGPASPEIATAVSCSVQGALQQWLSDKAVVERVDVTHQDSRLRITVQFSRLRDPRRQVAIFERETEG